MHIGTFTPEGTWRPRSGIAGTGWLGVTVLEVMPVADFPGRFGWGYDGVDLFAPTRLYGKPDDFRAFVDARTSRRWRDPRRRLQPLRARTATTSASSRLTISPTTTTTNGETRINFDGENPGRCANSSSRTRLTGSTNSISTACAWTPRSRSSTTPTEHILTAIDGVCATRPRGGPRSSSPKTNPSSRSWCDPPSTAATAWMPLWNDDFHHSAMVALTGRNEAYYTDYRGAPQEFVSAVKHGYLYQGQRYNWQKKRRGTPASELRAGAVRHVYSEPRPGRQSGRGSVCISSPAPGDYRAMTAFLLLGPGTPMLFQGQEFAASSAVLLFRRPQAGTRQAGARGRVEFLAQFRSLASAGDACLLCRSRRARPRFERCKLDFTERERNAGNTYAAPRSAAAPPRGSRVPPQRPGGVDGAVLAAGGVCAALLCGAERRPPAAGELGRGPASRSRARAAACATGRKRLGRLQWSSEDPRYGGCGTSPLETEEDWRIPGHAAVVLASSETSRRSGMTDLASTCFAVERTRSGIGPASARGMAGHQRPRRLRLGHSLGRSHGAITDC